MCKASIYAPKVEPAKEGKTYGIGISQHGLGAFHPLGQTTKECVVCVQDGMIVTLSGIPETLQVKYELEKDEVATFIDTGDNRHDLLDFGDGRRITLFCLANAGVQAGVGVPEAARAIAKAKIPAEEFLAIA